MDNDIPMDAWAIRQHRWDADNGEMMAAPWHRTREWIRRDGLASGIITECNRVYHPGDLELVGAPEQHPIGVLCMACFGINHSDKLLTDYSEE